MPDLIKLKMRLDILPGRKLENNYADRFLKYTQKLGESHEKMKQTNENMVNASKVSSSSEYESKVLSELKKAVREAKKLYDLISKEPEKIMSNATENGIVRLSENATSAKAKCKNIWEQEILSTVTKWEKMADVVQKLVPEEGDGFKQVVDSLRGREIPQDDEEVDQIKTDKKELKKYIANLELEGPFGKFLESTVEGGASLRDLLKDDEIMKKLEEHDLWDNFRIRLLG